MLDPAAFLSGGVFCDGIISMLENVAEKFVEGADHDQFVPFSPSFHLSEHAAGDMGEFSVTCGKMIKDQNRIAAYFFNRRSPARLEVINESRLKTMHS